MRRFPTWLLRSPWMVAAPPSYQPTYSQRPQLDWQRNALRVRPEPVERAKAPK